MTLPRSTILTKINIIEKIAAIFIVEFSIILSGFWMLGDFNKIRFGVWPMSEWLINYQGGFVRRGLIGEILIRLNSEQPLIPTLNQLTYYFFVIYCLVFLLIYFVAKIKNLKVLIVALLIPGGIFQMSISASFFTRKEILFLVLFGILCLVYLHIKIITKEKIKRWLTLFSSIAILSGIFLTLTHEAYLFMSFPYCAALFYILKKEHPDHLISKIGFYCYLILIPIVFVICVYQHGDIDTAEKIWNSLSLGDRLNISPHAPYTVYGAIGGIGWSKLQNLSTLYGVIATGGWVYWILFGIGNFSILSFIFISTVPRSVNASSGLYFKCTLIAFISSLLMFTIGSDWGRWIASIGNHLIFLGFTLIGSINRTENKNYHQKISIKNSFFLFKFRNITWLFILIVGYEMVFKMPECCIEYPYIFNEFRNLIHAFTN